MPRQLPAHSPTVAPVPFPRPARVGLATGAVVAVGMAVATWLHVPEALAAGGTCLLINGAAYRRVRGLPAPAALRRLVGPTWTAAGWAASSLIGAVVAAAATAAALAALEVAFR